MTATTGKSSLARRWVAVVAVILTSAGPDVRAHAIGSRHELPVPVWLFIVGGALTVTLTFVLVFAFVRAGTGRGPVRRHDLLRFAPFRCLVHPALVATLRWVAVALLGLVVAAGFIGSSDPDRNISPTLVWIVWWVGFSYFAMLVGDAWPVLNPWRTLFDGALRLLGSTAATPGPRPTTPYPERFGAWPAVALLLGFAWVEFIFPFRANPLTLSFIVIAYSVVTWLGMQRFGADTWLRNCDPFHVAFGLYGRFAPVAGGRAEGSPASGPRLFLRPYAGGVLGRGDEVVSLSMVGFVLAMLATVLFDGLLGSVYWVELENFVHSLRPTLGDAGWIGVHSAGLLGVWAIFLGMYLGTCTIMGRLGDAGLPPGTLARAFALTLLPIVIGYHFGHTFPLLLIQGQYIPGLVSDPFGFGMDLFGLGGARPDPALIDAKTAWYLAISAIVSGHVVSVYFAHVVAERLFPTRAAALRCLIPLTVLMVVYTAASLLILAEPLVKYSGPTEEIVSLPLSTGA